ncbi:MAG TPA: ABC transporter permease [Thermoanaerobaculia bacterium]|nr:ABC transporter permease [Thermoanaerobaculia bacterium]
METLAADVRFALRQLRKSPGFAVAAVLTLGLGIGANTAIFSVVRSVLLRPLPFAQDDRLVHVGHRTGVGLGDVQFSVPELGDYQRQTRSFSALTEYHSMIFTLVGHGEPGRVRTGVVSSSFFDVFGIRPLLGRPLSVGDDPLGREPVLLLTYEYWVKKLDRDPAIIGQALRMNGRPITVIGVLPPLPPYPGTDDVFISIPSCPFRSGESAHNNRSFHLIQMFGRLRPGVSLEQAAADVATISRRLHKEYPEAYALEPSVEVPLALVRDELTRNFRPVLLVLQGTVVLVLLIACGNLANLTLARLLSRQREMVLRAVFGAGRLRLIRQLLTESTLLALLGGVLGLFLARICTGLLAAFAARFTPRAAEVRFDVWVLLFALAVSVATGLVFGSLPALQLTRLNFAATLKEGGTRATIGAGGSRLRSLLVVLQVAASFVLLVGAGLTLRSVMKLQRVATGVDPSHVLTATITLPFTRYQEEPQIRRFFNRVIESLEVHPGVVGVAVGNDTPIANGPLNPTFKVEGAPVLRPDQQPQAGFHMVTLGYFDTLRVPLLAGRSFAARDTDADPKTPLVAMVNQSLARKLFAPGESPVGRRIALTNLGGGAWRTIVGVVGDVKQHGLDNEAGPGVYFPYEQAADGEGQLLVRTAGEPLMMVDDVLRAVHEVDPEQSVADVRTLEQVRRTLLAPAKLTATLIGLFALLAFVIAATGVSGVIAFFVSERTQEIGIRSALGATRGTVLALVLRQGMKLVTCGLALGALGALLLTGLLRGLLFGVEPTDPATFVLIATTLVAVVGIACLVPARRALRIEPVIALRS